MQLANDAVGRVLFGLRTNYEVCEFCRNSFRGAQVDKTKLDLDKKFEVLE